MFFLSLILYFFFFFFFNDTATTEIYTLSLHDALPILVVTWQIRVIAAGLKLSAARLGLPLNRRYPLRASFADEAGGGIGPATRVTWASDKPPVVAGAQDRAVSTASYGHARLTATAAGGK